MKNILKKLGIVGLTIAVLIPFIDIKVVKAEDEDCFKHIQSYFFLDHSSPKSYVDGGYTTYTTFPFAFPMEKNVEVKVTDVKINNFDYSNPDTALTQFYTDINELGDKLYNEYKNDTGLIGNYYVQSTSDEKYATSTYLLHGVWARYTEDGEPIESGDPNISVDTAVASTIQKIDYIQEAGVANSMMVYISGARYAGSDSRFYPLNPSADNEVCVATGSSYEDKVCEGTYYPSNEKNSIKTYLNWIINNFDAAANNDYVFKNSDDTYNFNVMVNRELNYDALPDTAKTDSTYTYWPIVMNVEYEACTVASEPIIDANWTIIYDENTTDTVKNSPDSVTAKINEKITIADGPTRDGYVFTKWCEDKEGKTNCYKAGDTYTSETEKTVTLYAQWGDTSEGEQTKTGITSYIIGFAAVGMIASTIYLISKKKNLFKQI